MMPPTNCLFSSITPDYVVPLGMRRFFMMLAATLLKIETRSVKFGFAVDAHLVLPSVE